MKKKRGNPDKLVPFKKGKDERRNTNGANKGSKWRKNLLQELATIPLDNIKDTAFAQTVEMFPEFFNGSDENNWQKFIEVKQLSLTHHKDPRVSQAAIKEIKDRIEGRAITKIAEVDTDGNNKVDTNESIEDIQSNIERLKDEFRKLQDSGGVKRSGSKPVKTNKAGRDKTGGKKVTGKAK